MQTSFDGVLSSLVEVGGDVGAIDELAAEIVEAIDDVVEEIVDAIDEVVEEIVDVIDEVEAEIVDEDDEVVELGLVAENVSSLSAFFVVELVEVAAEVEADLGKRSKKKLDIL